MAALQVLLLQRLKDGQGRKAIRVVKAYEGHFLLRLEWFAKEMECSSFEQFVVREAEVVQRTLPKNYGLYFAIS